MRSILLFEDEFDDDGAQEDDDTQHTTELPEFIICAATSTAHDSSQLPTLHTLDRSSERPCTRRRRLVDTPTQTRAPFATEAHTNMVEYSFLRCFLLLLSTLTEETDGMFVHAAGNALD